MERRIGFIGLGIMGMPMARSLIRAGFELVVYNRTAAKAQRLAAEGAEQAGCIRDLAAACPTVITMVPDTPDVESVMLGENGVLDSLKPGSVAIDMSTISPQATREMAGRFRDRGCHMLDAPVSGGEQGAINGTLSIMVGGDAGIFEDRRPVFEAMGKQIVHVGESGMGQTVKLMNQILVAGNLNAVVEALVFARSQGADLEKSIEAVKDGAAGSWQLANLGPRMIGRDFRPGFMIDLLQKDLKLAMETSESAKLPLPVTALVRQMLYSLQAAGEGRNGTQALVRYLERLSGIEIHGRQGQ
ncbi:MAG: 2-hydroxy-3-oxopropionate reductase [Dehalococcoidales bacterium]|nr:2-hydroxy-3-oxopropionate reductase [Dehalococcoidales bacterium]